MVRKAALLFLAGRHEETETAASQVLVVDPDFSVANWVRGQPYRDTAHIEPFAETLRQLGPPE